MSDDLADIADALTRIADVADLRPSRNEDAYHERSIWEELAGVVMFELPRIAHALDHLADTDAKTLLERAAAQAAAPSDEYERGRADERAAMENYIKDRQKWDGEDVLRGLILRQHLKATP